MTRITLTIPPDLAVWLRGYAASRGVSRSRCVCDVLVEKRAALAQEAQDLARLQATVHRFRRPRPA